MQFCDEDLVREALSGSHIAFERIMERYEGLVFWIAMSWSKNHENALDLCQDIFLKVYRKLAQYSGSGSFKSWLASVASREGASWSRRNKKHLVQTELTEEWEPALLPTQEEGLLKQEEVQQLMAEFRYLNTRQKLAISLRYFEKMSIHNIASVLNCSEGVAKNILFRSVQKLRKQMQISRRPQRDRL